MSKPIVVYQDGLRILVDPKDPERGAKPVIQYRLSPEEIEARYGHVKGSGKKSMSAWPKRNFNEVDAPKGEERECDTMKGLNIDVNRLLEICRKHGTGKQGVEVVSKEFGLTHKQAENQIFIKQIKRKLSAERSLEQQEDRAKETEGDSMTKEAPSPSKISEDLKLVPTRWMGGSGRTYEFRGDNLAVSTCNGEFVVQDIEAFIEELQELKKIGEAV